MVICITGSFDSSIVQSGVPTTINFAVNGVSSGSETVTIGGVVLQATSVYPTSYSPILKQWSYVTLDPSVPDDLLVATDFSATLYSTDADSTYEEIEIYILEIDVPTKVM